MEVSLLQHNRDVSPLGVDNGRIVEMVRGDLWPPGRQMAERAKNGQEIPNHF